jgi:hypothetical protein
MDPGATRPAMPHHRPWAHEFSAGGRKSPMKTTEPYNPALVAWVAEHVMGWRCYHHKDHNIQDIDDLCIAGGYTAIVEYSQTGDVLLVAPFDVEFGPTASWNPLTDANDDLMVLQKVRETWQQLDTEEMNGIVRDIFEDRHYASAKVIKDDNGKFLGRVHSDMLQYQCGDYTRAAAQAKGYKP